jgi:hypothetical protein
VPSQFQTRGGVNDFSTCTFLRLYVMATAVPCTGQQIGQENGRRGGYNHRICPLDRLGGGRPSATRCPISSRAWTCANTTNQGRNQGRNQGAEWATRGRLRTTSLHPRPPTLAEHAPTLLLHGSELADAVAGSDLRKHDKSGQKSGQKSGHRMGHERTFANHISPSAPPHVCRACRHPSPPWQ